jgi:hypothetical protein
MTRIQLAVICSALAATATYLTSSNGEVVHRSLTAYSNLIQDPRTVQSKISQLPQSMPTPRAEGKSFPVSTNFGNKNGIVQKRLTTQINSLAFMPAVNIANTQGLPTSKVNSNFDSVQNSLNQFTISQQASRVSQMQAHNIVPPNPGSQPQSSGIQKTSNLRPIQLNTDIAHQTQNQIQSKSITVTENLLKVQTGPTEGRTLPIPRASLDHGTEQNKQIHPSQRAESGPEPKGQGHDEEDDKGEAVATNNNMTEEEKSNAKLLNSLLRDSGSTIDMTSPAHLPAMLKSQRAGSNMDDLSNRDAEKQRFLKLMYGRSKPNKSGEY